MSWRHRWRACAWEKSIGCGYFEFLRELEDKGHFVLRICGHQQETANDFQQREYSAEAAWGTGHVNQSGEWSSRGPAERSRRGGAIVDGDAGDGAGLDAVVLERPP